MFNFFCKKNTNKWNEERIFGIRVADRVNSLIDKEKCDIEFKVMLIPDCSNALIKSHSTILLWRRK